MRDYVKRYTLTPGIYKVLRDAFRSGNTHANMVSICYSNSDKGENVINDRRYQND